MKATNISRIFLKISSTKVGHTSLDMEVNPVIPTAQSQGEEEL